LPGEKKFALARRLRREATDAERKLWFFLRDKRFGGLRWRRQQPIGPYVVDFFCPSERLIVELDGGQHGDERVKAYDDDRTRWLQARGYRVIRLWNVDFLEDPATAVDFLWSQMRQATPHPTASRSTSPSRGEV
jgi:very-short-patch-repair endonuclease